MITALNHFTVIAEDPQRTLDFYVGLLGLVVGHRPELGFPGAWLYAEGSSQALVHVYFDRPVPVQRSGVIDHMAFSARGLEDVKERFDKRGVGYEVRRGAGIWQLFCRDPNGARVELDFDGSEGSLAA